MAVSNLVAASSGLTTTRFPAAIGNPFHIPAGITLRNTITSSTSFAAGTFPSQIWVVLIGAGGGGSNGGSGSIGSGGGGGGACIGWMDVPSSGTLYAVIGSGGTGGNGGTNATAGNVGGNTTLGSLIAYGGGPGYGGNLVSATAFGSIMFPRGPGAGSGGTSASQIAANTFAPVVFVPNSAPWTTARPVGPLHNWSTSSSYSVFNPTTAEYSNFTGGGAGYGFYNLNGGDGLTGGGNAGSTGSSFRGGNSSRDGGTTFTFTGSTTTTVNGAAGAGFLANGSGATGGSGGGGGAGQYQSNQGGTGGNGCILIYY